MTVVNLTKINIIAVLTKIKVIEESNTSNKYSRIVDLLDSTKSVFNVSLDSYKNMELLNDTIEFSTTGSILWDRMKTRYTDLADE
jgi:GTPase Era involved in 16S rRNA processing